MKKVITYGTFDLLHFGHINLLKRAKELGDYLVVGVTSDSFDMSRGKINVRQSLIERIEAVKNTGLADEIVVEEYEGQKIDDIKRLNIDIFTVGSDWVGKFDYLNEYCKVIYLERTKGISSTMIRDGSLVRLGVIGDAPFINKFVEESKYVNGIEVTCICTKRADIIKESIKEFVSVVTDNYSELLSCVDAVYIISSPYLHTSVIEKALNCNKHVLCESPITINENDYNRLSALADEKGLILSEAIRTAYSTAYDRLRLLLKSGIIGKIISIDATCTSLRNHNNVTNYSELWNSICMWGPTAMLPVFQILGVEYSKKSIVSKIIDKDSRFDSFSKLSFVYPNAVATVKVGNGIKSESELIISGTNGYLYVPSPWWKTDYFEVRFENQENNRRYFYQLDGEGIRYELVAFINSIKAKKASEYVERHVSREIVKVIEDYYNGIDCIEIS